MSKNDNQEHDHNESFSSPHPKYLDSYVKLTNARCIFITEDFTKEMSSAVSALLFHFDNESNEEITIYISSNGGDSTALHCIVDTIQMISAPVSTVCLGTAYSAAAFLLSAGAKGRRFAMKHCEIMIHSVSCLFPLPGEASAVASKNYLGFINTVNDGVLNILVKNTGKTLKQVREDCSRDFFMTAPEAKKYGMIDDIL